MTNLPLSILDQTPIGAGSNAISALAETVELARLGDALGYRRFWVAEHHGSPTFAGAAPEVLIPALAMATTRITLGAGGVMLPHYSPYKVAECFSVAAGLAPGRIDLGLGRATGSDGRAALALQRDRRSRMGYSDFDAQLGELAAYLDAKDHFPTDHPFAALRRHLPHGGRPPTLWILGTSQDSARLAGLRGLPYAIADFINPHGSSLARLYRECFRPTDALPEPYVIVATPAICAREHGRAADLRYPFLMVLARLFRGEVVAVPGIGEAKEWFKRNPTDIGSIMNLTFGDPVEVREGLLAIVDEYGADELMISNVVPERDARLESYRLIFEAFQPLEGIP
ncbi:LLM class flavin-dependent oxidoreductase [Nitrospirillum viridazoti]|nr:LLM class flavin-dependent oxidoreductase [Nitrospirillum amazonense]